MPENFFPTLCEIGTSCGKGTKYSLHITLGYRKQIGHPYAVEIFLQFQDQYKT